MHLPTSRRRAARTADTNAQELIAARVAARWNTPADTDPPTTTAGWPQSGKTATTVALTLAAALDRDHHGHDGGPSDTPPAAARPTPLTRLDLDAARRPEPAAPVEPVELPHAA